MQTKIKIQIAFHIGTLSFYRKTEVKIGESHSFFVAKWKNAYKIGQKSKIYGNYTLTLPEGLQKSQKLSI